MALFHLSVTQTKRSAGQSAIASRLCGSHPMAIARNMQITEYHYSLLNGENVLLPVKNSQVHMRFTVITNCPGILEAMIPMGILF